MALASLCVAQFLISAEILLSAAVVGAIGLGVAAAVNRDAARDRWKFAARAIGIAAAMTALLLAYPLWLLTAGPARIAGPAQETSLYRGNLLALVIPDSSWGKGGSRTAAAPVQHSQRHARSWGYTRWKRHIFILVFATRYQHPASGSRHLDRDCGDHAGRARRLRRGAGRVHRRGQPRAPASELPPAVAIFRMVNSLNGVCSRRLRQEFPDLHRRYWRARRLWSLHCLAGPADGAPSRSRASTSSSRTVLPEDGLGPSAFTTGLKAGALVDILVAALTTVAALVISLGSRLTAGRYVWTAVPLPEAVLTRIPVLDNTIAARYSLYVPLGAAVMLALTIEALRERVRQGGRRPAGAAGAACAALACLALLPLVPAWPYGARVAQVPRYFSSALVTAIPDGSVAVQYPFPAAGDAIPMLWQVAAGMRFKAPGGRFVIPAPGSAGTPESGRPALVGRIFGQLAAGRLPALTPALRRALRGQLRSWHVRAVLVHVSGRRPGLVMPFFEWLLGRPPDVRSGGISAWYE